jgi:catechol 2,3-dioxygenase-like lactoylglutathione lyase family enzyme
MALPEITNVLTEVLVTDHDAAIEWYTALFGRPPDRRPMDGLAEWQLTPTGGLQVFERAEGAGSCFATLVVQTVAPVTEHLATIGIDSDMQTVSSGFAIASVHDPDGNTLIFAGSREEG